jgi:hypothetical protein
LGGRDLEMIELGTSENRGTTEDRFTLFVRISEIGQNLDRGIKPLSFKGIMKKGGFEDGKEN